MADGHKIVATCLVVVFVTVAIAQNWVVALRDAIDRKVSGSSSSETTPGVLPGQNNPPISSGRVNLNPLAPGTVNGPSGPQINPGPQVPFGQ